MQRLVSNSFSQLPWENRLFETKTLICLWIEVLTVVYPYQLFSVFLLYPFEIHIFSIRFSLLHSTGRELATYLESDMR